MVLVARVEVVELALGDIAHLGAADLETLVLAAGLGFLLGGNDLAALFLFQRNAGSLLEENRRGRAFHLKGETAIRKHRDNYRHGDAPLVLGPIVELRDKLPDIDAMLAQRRPDGRRGGCLSAGNLEANLGCQLLCHFRVFPCYPWLMLFMRNLPASIPARPARAVRRWSARPAGCPWLPELP